MQGIICLWSGDVIDIPAGWTLCDGSNGSPDLRNKFIVGAGDTYNPDDSGGASSHFHAFTSDVHSHDIGTGDLVGSGNTFDNYTDEITVEGDTESASSLPPYYALCYIMKL